MNDFNNQIDNQIMMNQQNNFIHQGMNSQRGMYFNNNQMNGFPQGIGMNNNNQTNMMNNFQQQMQPYNNK